MNRRWWLSLLPMFLVALVPDRFEDGVILLIGITGEDQAVCESQFGIDFHDFWVKLL